MYPDYIMAYVRQRLGLKADDTSRDNYIMELDKDMVFDMVCEWNGLLGGYGEQIRRWICDIFEISL